MGLKNGFLAPFRSWQNCPFKLKVKHFPERAQLRLTTLKIDYLLDLYDKQRAQPCSVFSLIILCDHRRFIFSLNFIFWNNIGKSVEYFVWCTSTSVHRKFRNYYRSPFKLAKNEPEKKFNKPGFWMDVNVGDQEQFDLFVIILCSS